MADNVIEFVIEGKNAFGKVFDALNVNLTSLKSAVVGLGVGAFVRTTTQALDFASAIKETADRLDFSTGALQQWRFVAEQSGASAEKLDQALGMFSRTIGTAAAGSGEAQKALARVGITLNEINTLSPEQLFERTRDAISGMGSAAQRNQLLMQLFGRQGKDLGNVFAESSGEIARMRMEAEKLGAVMDENTIASAKKTKDELDAMTTVIKNQLSAALVAIAPLFIKVAENIAFVATKTKEAIAAFGHFFRQDWDAALSPYDKLLLRQNQLTDQIKSLEGESGLFRWLENGNSRLVSLRAELEKVTAELGKLQAGYQKGTPDAALPPPAPKNKIDPDYLRSLQAQYAAARGLKLQALELERADQLRKLQQMNLDEAGFAAASDLINVTAQQKKYQLSLEYMEKLKGLGDEATIARKWQLDEEVAQMREAKIAETEVARYYASQMLQMEADRITERQAQREQELTNMITTAESMSVVLDASLLKWSETVSSWQMTMSESIMSTMNSMIDGLSMAVANAIVYGDNLGEAIKKTMQSAAATVIGMLVKIGLQMLASWLISKFVTTKQASSELARGLMAVYVNSFASAAAIPFYGWLIAPAVAAANLAIATTGSAAAAATGSGMGAALVGAAHGGLEDVPREGTFLLDKGERVLSPAQNRDLTDFLSATNEQGQSVYVQQLVINVDVPDSKALIAMDRNDWRDIVARNVIPALDALDRMGVRQVALERQRGS